MTEVVCAIICEQGKYLATRRGKGMSNPNKWEFPGGKVNKDESIEEAIIREIFEELSINIEPLRVLTPVEFKYEIKSIRLIPIVCRIPKPYTIKLKEHQQYGWFTFEELHILNLSDADRKLILERNNQEFLVHNSGE